MSVVGREGHPLKIAYICYWNLYAEDGVTKKINAQVDQWRAAGNEVEVFCLSPAPEAPRSPTLAARPFLFDSFRSRFSATRRIVAAARAFQPDFIYLRYDLFLPPFQRILAVAPSAVEVQGNDLDEIPLRRLRARLVGIYNAFYRRTILGRGSGIVCVTYELARSSIFASFRKPTAVIANGIDLTQVRPLSPPTAERPRVVFLGSPGHAWHGVDKIVALAHVMPDHDFDIVGFDTRNLASARPLPENLTARGILSRPEYEPIIASADAAIGTLALHRKGMSEACPLKVREYLGYGLPTIIGYEDTDFIGAEPWYLLRLPNEESNAVDHVAEIRTFIERVRGRRVEPSEVAARIGANAKEAARLEFMAQLIRDTRR